MKVKAGIYIDDAGTPGTQSKSEFLDESRKSWCGVIVPPLVSAEISKIMEKILAAIEQEYGADELHCTDIYSGRGAWKIDVEKRIEIFELLSQIPIKYQLPIFYQTFDRNSKRDHAKLFKQLQRYKIEFWDFQNIAHLSLIFLMQKIKKGIKELREITSNHEFDHEFAIYIDEGIAKAGNKFLLPVLPENIFEKKLSFENSKNCAGIQIADFVAFICSKSQWILMKKESGKNFSNADKHILEIVSKFNHWSMDIMHVDEENLSREGIEFYLTRDRIDKNLKTPRG